MQKSKCKTTNQKLKITQHCVAPGKFLSVPPPRAETILEVIIAVAVIMVILAPASALYISSMRNTAVNRNELIAAALAEEGIEIVRNIRDTNFIKFSDQARDCWNTVPQPNPAQGGCDAAANKITADKYRLAVDITNGNWALKPATAALTDDLSGGANDEEYRLTLDAGTYLYYHAPPSPPGVAPPDPSPFYREITLQYSSGGNALSVASAVLFRSGTIVRAVLKHDILTQSPL